MEEPEVIPFCDMELSSPETAVDPAIYWTLDTDEGDTGWNDTSGDYALAHVDSLELDATLRIKGKGASLGLNGQQYATFSGTSSDAPFSKEFTISAWIALAVPEVGSTLVDGKPVAPSKDTTWPILSTRSAALGCGGYELSLKHYGTSPIPALSFAYDKVENAGAGNAVCPQHEVRFPLPPWTLRDGRWHHVAASYRYNDGYPAVALFWDTSLVAQDDSLSPRAADTILDFPTTLYFGANREIAAGIASAQTPNVPPTTFTGNIDEVAVFSRTLDAGDLMAFVTKTTTIDGPGYTISETESGNTTPTVKCKRNHLRWRATESRDWAAKSTSTISEFTSNDANELTLVVDDKQWSQGAIEAKIWPPLDLTRASTLYLDATVSTDKAFQVTVGNPDGYCTWIQGPVPVETAESDYDRYYKVDLTHPVNCFSSNCDFDLSSASWISIGTEWLIPDGFLKQRPPGTVAIAVRQLLFSRDATSEKRSSAGATGPRGWCWRTQLFETEGSASISALDNSISAILSGTASSATRVVAAFESGWLDLSGCTGVRINATYDPAQESSTDYYSFVMQDAVGAWRSCEISQSQPQSIDSGTGCEESDSGNFEGFPKVELKRIRYIGIQKPYTSKITSTIELKDIQFFGKNNQSGCEVPSQ